VPLGACASAATGRWLPAACKHTVLQEFAPQQAATLPSLLEKLEPPLEAVHGFAQNTNGAGSVLAGQHQVLANLLREKLGAEAPKAKLRLLLRMQLAILMLIAPENDGGPLRSTESHPLESLCFARSGKTFFT